MKAVAKRKKSNRKKRRERRRRQFMEPVKQQPVAHADQDQSAEQFDVTNALTSPKKPAPHAAMNEMTTNAKDHEANQKKNKPSFWEFAALIAAIGAAIGSIWQGHGTSRSVDTLEQQTHASLRAYMFLDSEKPIESLTVEIGKEPSGMLRVKNYGQTPASRLITLRGTGNGPWPLTHADFTITPTEEPAQSGPPGAITYWALVEAWTANRAAEQ